MLQTNEMSPIFFQLVKITFFTSVWFQNHESYASNMMKLRCVIDILMSQVHEIGFNQRIQPLISIGQLH